MFSQGLGKSLFVGTIAWTFAFINMSKLPFYYAIDLIDMKVLIFDVWMLPFIPLGSWLGKWMHDRVSESIFNWVILVLTLIAGIQLIFDINLIKEGLALFFTG